MFAHGIVPGQCWRVQSEFPVGGFRDTCAGGSQLQQVQGHWCMGNGLFVVCVCVAQVPAGFADGTKWERLCGDKGCCM
jgi:hypothetical protein